MKQLKEPRDDNPKHEFDEAAGKVRLICTDCEPHRIVTDRDVSHWHGMTAAAADRDGAICGAADYAIWLTHMSHEHNIVPGGPDVVEMDLPGGGSVRIFSKTVS
jgi:hypothetical protein